MTARLTEEIPGTGLSCVIPTPAEAAAVCVLRCRPLPLHRTLTGTACRSSDQQPAPTPALTGAPLRRPARGRSQPAANQTHRPPERDYSVATSQNPEDFAGYMYADRKSKSQLWVSSSTPDLPVSTPSVLLMSQKLQLQL